MTSLENQSPTWQELPAYLSLSFWGHEHMEQDSNIVTVRPRKDKEHSLTYMPAYQELGELNPPPKGLLTTNRALKHLPGTPGHDLQVCLDLIMQALHITDKAQTDRNINQIQKYRSQMPGQVTRCVVP